MRRIAFVALALSAGCAPLVPSMAQAPVTADSQPDSSSVQGGQTTLSDGVSWADLADLADAAPMVVRAEIRNQAELKPERAPGLAAGYTRLYIEARTGALIAGNAAVGESLAYLVDVPLNAKGRAPKLKKQQVILFARDVPGQPGVIQLVKPDAQLDWSPALEARLRPILSAFADPAARPAVTAIRDALSVEGNLSGESETQIFLATASGDPASITVVRRPGAPPRWGVSWSDIVDQAAAAPRRDTLAWYRLACFLPRTLPASASLSNDAAARQRAAADYAFVLDELGPCDRRMNFAP
ncbi:hypothetical protein HME9302_02263 [Alteripontixanthobacter maritimus]|uniref:Lipoprotein n=1 Tax=Alteripontixanthobacter maritimus TaxID=2161824 RepID=A0A369QCT3_9SPHN|nr:hypothetical protein [Alteripontixanthobacter maritimus]RDC61046.1 hypothetical protein HME9302_02263 [Alteripontixanthobacter maritimus]